MDVKKKRIQFVVFLAAVIFLSITAEKCRQMVGEKFSSQSGKFSIFDCFDGSTGTIACMFKEGIKLYSNSIKSTHIELARHQAIEAALVDAVSQGLTAKDAVKQAQKHGAKAAKMANKEAKRILGPIISSGWDFFEAIYYKGTTAEGFSRGTGTLVGTYAGGFLGEPRFGRFGYLVGSQLGSWVGGRIGLMAYDVINGVNYLLTFTEMEENILSENPPDTESKDYDTAALETSLDSEAGNIFFDLISKMLFGTPSDSKDSDTSRLESSEHSKDFSAYETPTTYMASESSGDSKSYESPVYENSESHQEF